MDEETTTPVAEETGAEAQPVTEAPAEAVETTVADTEEQTEEATPSASDEDAELAKWATAKGLELDSDNAKKAAKMARESEKAFHAKSQKASELEKSVSTAADAYATEEAERTGQDPELLKRVQRMEVDNAIGKFYRENPDASKYDSAMGELVKERPYLAGDLEALYALAVTRTGGVTAVKSQAKRDTLTELAHKQQAAVPTGNATTTSAPKKKDFKDLSLAEMEKQLGFAPR